MIEQDSFVGVEGFIAEKSLKCEGLVCRNEKSDQYYCIYKLDPYTYSDGFICESEIDNFVKLDTTYKEKSEITDFLGKLNKTESEFLELPFVNKLQYLIDNFGHEEIMGKPIEYLTFDEAMYIVENE
jgi:hypothetical protein